MDVQVPREQPPPLLVEQADVAEGVPPIKERFFKPFLSAYGDRRRRAGGGRDLLMQQTLSNYRSLLALCPELAELETRILQILAEL
ncbi:MAG: hypothetical protein WAM82_36435 [Thermoanaerobaculia bacterium]